MVQNGEGPGEGVLNTTSDWKKVELSDGTWWICNDCGSLDEHGRIRRFKCRTTDPATFNLCDGGIADVPELVLLQA